MAEWVVQRLDWLDLDPRIPRQLFKCTMDGFSQWVRLPRPMTRPQLVLHLTTVIALLDLTTLRGGNVTSMVCAKAGIVIREGKEQAIGPSPLERGD
jgi:hypothetical protein